MKNLRNLIAAVTLMAVLVMGSISANAGILLGDLKGNSDTCANDTKVDSGIIIGGFTGIIIGGFTGIIIGGVSGTGCQEQSDSGILLGD